MWPCQAFYDFFFFFSLDIGDRLKYPKNTKKQISGEKNREKKKHRIVQKRLGRGKETRVQIFSVYLKNGVDIGL